MVYVILLNGQIVVVTRTEKLAEKLKRSIEFVCRLCEAAAGKRLDCVVEMEEWTVFEEEE